MFCFLVKLPHRLEIIMKAYSYSQIQDYLNTARTVLIAMPKDISFDQVAAGLALYLSLQKAGRQVMIACPDPMRVEFSRLVGVDKVADKLTGSDIAITLNYPIDGIEKVTSNDQDGKLNLVVKLKTGQPPIDFSQVSFSQVGANADLIFTIGLRKFEGLGKIYYDNKELFESKPIINIDSNNTNSAYGKLNIIDAEASSISEITSFIITGAQLPEDADIATNLMLGIESATDNLQSITVTADTFEAAAAALRAGGRRSGIIQGELSSTTINKPQNPELEKKPASEIPQQPAEPTSDWLEPKIYKGSTLP